MTRIAKRKDEKDYILTKCQPHHFCSILPHENRLFATEQPFARKFANLYSAKHCK